MPVRTHILAGQSNDTIEGLASTGEKQAVAGWTVKAVVPEPWRIEFPRDVIGGLRYSETQGRQFDSQQVATTTLPSRFSDEAKICRTLRLLPEDSVCARPAATSLRRVHPVSGTHPLYIDRSPAGPNRGKKGRPPQWGHTRRPLALKGERRRMGTHRSR